VKHPFIVGMNMAFQSKDKLYFVLDYCAGGELFFHLGKLGKFPENRSRFYAAEIVLAISYVHSLDIIYRDLKPENVLLDAQGHIRLTDFGLSKEGISSSSSGANSFCGTPEYLAPEILNRQGHGRAVDWWSLGALLYEMLTGLPPFYCQDRERLFEKIRRSELHYPASVSAPAKSVLVGLLTKDPTRRLGSGSEDSDKIKRHDFFKEIDFRKCLREKSPRLGDRTFHPIWIRASLTKNLPTCQYSVHRACKGCMGLGQHQARIISLKVLPLPIAISCMVLVRRKQGLNGRTTINKEGRRALLMAEINEKLIPGYGDDCCFIYI
jgi:serine/threonine protein kinase